MKKPRMKLVNCAEALRKLNISSPIGVIEELIADGHYHLKELRSAPKCDPLLISSLVYRIERAEGIFEQKKKQEAAQ